MTKGIKTSLHEVRHAVIAELLGYEVQSIHVLERFKGYTRYKKNPENQFTPMKDTFLIGIAPYVVRIINMKEEDFLDEYWGLICHEYISWAYEHAKKEGILYWIVRELMIILFMNKPLVDYLVDKLDKNGKGTTATITRNEFKKAMEKYPLKGQQTMKRLKEWLEYHW